MPVEVYKTNVKHHYDAIKLKELLLKEFPAADVRFDLQSGTANLRIEGHSVPVARVVQIIKHAGFYCEVAEHMQ